MAEPSAFETLVLELDPQERGALLEKLVRVSSVSREPLAPLRDMPEETVDYSEILAGMGFFARLFITILSMLSGKPKEFLVLEKLLKQIAHSVESSCPGILDYRRKVLLEPFHTELSSLRQAARYFYELLDRTLEKSRGPFFAFLGSLQFERVHDELTSDADPYVFSQRNALAEESDVRTAVNAAFETAMSHIDEDSRRSMLHDVRNLHALKRLSAFLYDRLLGQFRPAQNGRKELSVLAISEQLLDLAEILSALETPSARLMESMIAFSMGEDMGNENFDLDAAVKKELGQAEKALQAIRSFNARVPMALLVNDLLVVNVASRGIVNSKNHPPIYS
ncbi:MAG TPA: DUF5312 family protein [Spirochaetales bacterium]|nr:DUF5312 family protein [Spirochaetales bacterium]